MQEVSRNNERAKSNNLITLIFYINIPTTENFKSQLADRFAMTYLPSFATLLKATSFGK